MSDFATEQLAEVQRANLATLFALTNKAFEGFQKLAELNLQVAKSTIAESQDNLEKVLAGKDLRDVFAVQSGLAQPAAEKAIAYARQLYEIASSTQAEFTKVAEAHYEQHSRSVQVLVDNFVKNAPAGAEAATALLQSTFSAANSTYETVNAAAKQAVEVAKTNFDAAAVAASGAAKQAASQASRAAKQ